MSCIRFNTPAQLAQLRSMAPAMLTPAQAEALHPSPEITPAKINRLRLLAADRNPKIRESVASSPHTPEDVFFDLAQDTDEGVRAALPAMRVRRAARFDCLQTIRRSAFGGFLR